MKNIIAMLVIFFFIAAPVFGSTPTAAPDSEERTTTAEETQQDSLSEQIDDLKDKIASRVAELNLVDKRGIIGTVQEVKNTQITILDPQQKTRIVDVDAITKFSSPSAKSTFGISDISRGTTINVTGLYNKQSRRILARFVEGTTMPRFISGTITEINRDDFTFTVTHADGKETIIDVENITRTNSYTRDTDMVRSGYSQLVTDVRVVVTGYLNKAEKDRMTGIRVLVLPEIESDNRDAVTPTEEVSATESPEEDTETP